MSHISSSRAFPSSGSTRSSTLSIPPALQDPFGIDAISHRGDNPDRRWFPDKAAQALIEEDKTAIPQPHRAASRNHVLGYIESDPMSQTGFNRSTIGRRPSATRRPSLFTNSSANANANAGRNSTTNEQGTSTRSPSSQRSPTGVTDQSNNPRHTTTSEGAVSDQSNPPNATAVSKWIGPIGPLQTVREGKATDMNEGGSRKIENRAPNPQGEQTHVDASTQTEEHRPRTVAELDQLCRALQRVVESQDETIRVLKAQMQNAVSKAKAEAMMSQNITATDMIAQLTVVKEDAVKAMAGKADQQTLTSLLKRKADKETFDTIQSQVRDVQDVLSSTAMQFETAVADRHHVTHVLEQQQQKILEILTNLEKKQGANTVGSSLHSEMGGRLSGSAPDQYSLMNKMLSQSAPSSPPMLPRVKSKPRNSTSGEGEDDDEAEEKKARKMRRKKRRERKKKRKTEKEAEDLGADPEVTSGWVHELDEHVGRRNEKVGGPEKSSERRRRGNRRGTSDSEDGTDSDNDSDEADGTSTEDSDDASTDDEEYDENGNRHGKKQRRALIEYKQKRKTLIETVPPEELVSLQSRVDRVELSLQLYLRASKAAEAGTGLNIGGAGSSGPFSSGSSTLNALGIGSSQSSNPHHLRRHEAESQIASAASLIVDAAKKRIQGDVEALENELLEARNKHAEVCFDVASLQDKISPDDLSVMETRRGLDQLERDMATLNSRIDRLDTASAVARGAYNTVKQQHEQTVTHVQDIAKLCREHVSSRNAFVHRLEASKTWIEARTQTIMAKLKDFTSQMNTTLETLAKEVANVVRAHQSMESGLSLWRGDVEDRVAALTLAAGNSADIVGVLRESVEKKVFSSVSSLPKVANVSQQSIERQSKLVQLIIDASQSKGRQCMDAMEVIQSSRNQPTVKDVASLTFSLLTSSSQSASQSSASSSALHLNSNTTNNTLTLVPTQSQQQQQQQQHDLQVMRRLALTASLLERPRPMTSPTGVNRLGNPFDSTSSSSSSISQNVGRTGGESNATSSKAKDVDGNLVEKVIEKGFAATAAELTHRPLTSHTTVTDPTDASMTDVPDNKNNNQGNTSHRTRPWTVGSSQRLNKRPDYHPVHHPLAWKPGGSTQSGKDVADKLLPIGLPGRRKSPTRQRYHEQSAQEQSFAGYDYNDMKGSSDDVVNGEREETRPGGSYSNEQLTSASGWQIRRDYTSDPPKTAPVPTTVHNTPSTSSSSSTSIASSSSSPKAALKSNEPKALLSEAWWATQFADGEKGGIGYHLNKGDSSVTQHHESLGYNAGIGTGGSIGDDDVNNDDNDAQGKSPSLSSLSLTLPTTGLQQPSQLRDRHSPCIRPLGSDSPSLKGSPSLRGTSLTSMNGGQSPPGQRRPSLSMKAPRPPPLRLSARFGQPGDNTNNNSSNSTDMMSSNSSSGVNWRSVPHANVLTPVSMPTPQNVFQPKTPEALRTSRPGRRSNLSGRRASKVSVDEGDEDEDENTISLNKPSGLVDPSTSHGVLGTQSHPQGHAENNQGSLMGLNSDSSIRVLLDGEVSLAMHHALFAEERTTKVPQNHKQVNTAVNPSSTSTSTSIPPKSISSQARPLSSRSGLAKTQLSKELAIASKRAVECSLAGWTDADQYTLDQRLALDRI